MDKSWMKLSNRFCKAYMDGVSLFIDVAKHHLNEDGKTRCPCRNCLNVEYKKIDDVIADLYKYGISQSYQRWMYHGEVVDLSENVSNMSTMHNDEVLEEGDGLLEMLHDVGGQIPVGSGSIDDQDEGVESDHVQPGVAATTFDELLQ
ncbi:hypothetical protein LWI29_028116 [Acer saccharum]|uniref:Transposase-associated domain-containing protein n=1 Tax=Acer saccharum TaxID=4024 RepID=A0AA39REC5_ACESA|nr:hypothetical protein LWI29_028116 [Acer saccharum]